MAKEFRKVMMNKKLLLFIAMIMLGIGLVVGINKIATTPHENEHEQVADANDTDSIEENDSTEEVIDEVEPLVTDNEEAEQAPNEELEKDSDEIEDESTFPIESVEEHKEQPKNDDSKGTATTEVKEQRPAENVTKPKEPTKPKEESKSTQKPNDKPKPDVVVKQPTTPKKTVHLTVVGSQDMGTIVSTVEVEITDSETVQDVLQRVLREKSIQMEATGRGGKVYVKGINNLYEFDLGPGSGWMYSVNGSFPTRSAGIWPVKQGDHIRWLYTLDLGKDLGAG